MSIKTAFYIALLIVCLAAAAAAQTTRVYVAGTTGDDTYQCTAAAPCKTIAKAVSVVDAGGQVILSETGSYDPFLVNKSVTVMAAAGVNAAVVASGGSAVSIAGVNPADVINFRDLHFVGTNGQAASGMINSFAGTLNVDGCVFTGFDNAVTMSNVAGYLFVHNSTFRNNVFGVGAIGPNAEGIERVTIDSCTFESNEVGVSFTNKVTGVIRNSVLADSASRAIRLSSNTARWTADATVDNCQINYNTVGVLMSATNGGFTTLRLFRSSIVGSQLAGISLGANSTAYSLGNNLFANNFPDVSGGSLVSQQPK